MNMTVNVLPTPQELGRAAAKKISALLNEAIALKGEARLLLSTGASQFETIAALLAEDVDWSKVEMFHLDEYVGLPKTHPASFRKYLKERFTGRVGLKAAHFVDGEGDVAANIEALAEELKKTPVDVGVIGIGENGHIAFNDPPADFDCEEAFIVVELAEKCKRQQVGEGWFSGIEDVPQKAVTMTVKQMLSCKTVVSCVPHAVKAEAVKNTLTTPPAPAVPASVLKTHPDWHLYLDQASASGLFRV